MVASEKRSELSEKTPDYVGRALGRAEGSSHSGRGPKARYRCGGRWMEQPTSDASPTATRRVAFRRRKATTSRCLSCPFPPLPRFLAGRCNFLCSFPTAVTAQASTLAAITDSDNRTFGVCQMSTDTLYFPRLADYATVAVSGGPDPYRARGFAARPCIDWLVQDAVDAFAALSSARAGRPLVISSALTDPSLATCATHATRDEGSRIGPPPHSVSALTKLFESSFDQIQPYSFRRTPW